MITESSLIFNEVLSVSIIPRLASFLFLWAKISILMIMEILTSRNSYNIQYLQYGINQSILKEISPGCSLEGMMLKLKLQYFGHLMQRVDSLEKNDAGRDWGQEEKGTTEDEMAGWHH